MVGASGREVIAGIIAGYEIQIRLSLALGPTNHYERGFHPTATCGIFGSVAAAGRVLKLNPKQIESAFGVALSQSAGSMQFLHEGGWTKRSHVGQAAMNGLIAATMAREGFRGAIDPIEGKAGFLSIYSPSSDLTKAISGIGKYWETMSIAIKPYPSCRYSHAPLDAIRNLMRENSISVNEILNVSIGVSQTAWNIIGGPIEQKQNPQSIVDGQFSMPFCAAVVIREGNLVWDNYASHVNDSETLALCKRIDTRVGQRAEIEFPKNMSGSVKITTSRGIFETYVQVPKGEPGNFVSETELRNKFDGLVKPYLGKTPTAMFADSILAIERENSITQLLNQSHPSQPLAMAGE
jgi:2-methylcitrate dehydratase PrpD